MNKLNYVLAPLTIALLIGNVFLYSSLIKQNSDIKKDISDIKKEQTNQQANQKEALENLQNLVTFNWKEYQNDEFGFSFKYPEYVNICDDTAKSQDIVKSELNLAIRDGGELDTCDVRDVPLTKIIIKKNSENYKTAEEAFYKELPADYLTQDPFYNKEFQEVYSTLNKNNFSYFKIGGLDAYGGIVAFSKPTSSSGIAFMESYKVVVLNNDNITKFIDNLYDQSSKNKRLGDKSIFDAIISSFYFNPSIQ